MSKEGAVSGKKTGVVGENLQPWDQRVGGDGGGHVSREKYFVVGDEIRT